MTTPAVSPSTGRGDRGGRSSGRDGALVRAAVAGAGLLAALTGLVAADPRWLAVDVDGRLSTAVRTGLAGHHGVLDTVRVLTWLGHPLVVDAIVLVAAAVLWWRGARSAAVSLVVVGPVSLLVRAAVKDVLARPRPPGGFSTASGGSFPSGHTAGAAFVAVAAVVLLRRAWVAVVAVTYAVVVGASRILLDVHWLSDVVGGLLLGATFALLLPWARTRIGERRPAWAGRHSPIGEPGATG